MCARLLYGVLLIGSLAMLLFVAGFALLHLGLGLLTALFYAVAGKTMLLAFGLLFLLGAAALLSAIWRELGAYFCREAAALRRILALQTQQQHSALRSAEEWRQLQYFNRFKRQRLLAANNRKHLKALFEAIRQELQAMKAQLPAETYKSLYKALRNHHKRADSQAMLALRREISCR
ncbi:MAG: hypothetical protein ACXV7J_08425 [Methylomonas sp.]